MSDLKPGDILLMTREDSAFIKLFCHCVGFLDNYDGKPPVCHAAIVDRNLQSATMWTGGFEIVSVGDELAQSPVCYQYRWANQSTDLSPVLDTIDRYAAANPPYAWMDYALLPFIASSRKIAADTLSIIQQAELRAVIDSCCDELEGWLRLNKSALICSELVYRCYAESGLPPEILMCGFFEDQFEWIAKYVQSELVSRFRGLWSRFTTTNGVSPFWVTPADLIKSPSFVFVDQIK